MWTTDVLREEHRWILCMLQSLERLTLASERDQRLDAACAGELLALFTFFADGLHQEREERYLFPRLLARARSPEERMDIGRLCGEHEEERRVMARMNQVLLGAVFGQTQSLREFQRAALRYVAMQRRHLQHENQALLPLAEQLLTREDDEATMQGFVDLEHGSPQKLKQVFERIQYLCGRLGIEAAPTA
jgi:hemerythrin-like domain-containing protein